jgi:hypothetical protein
LTNSGVVLEFGRDNHACRAALAGSRDGRFAFCASEGKPAQHAEAVERRNDKTREAVKQRREWSAVQGVSCFTQVLRKHFCFTCQAFVTVKALAKGRAGREH